MRNSVFYSAIAFLCRITGGVLVVTDEASKSRYFELENLPHNAIALHLDRLWDVIQDLDRPIIRRQARTSADVVLQKIQATLEKSP